MTPPQDPLRGIRCLAPGAAAFDWRRALQLGLFVTGFALLGLYVAAKIESKAFNVYQEWRLGRRQADPGHAVPPRPPPAPGETIGMLEIERLGVRAAVVEGTSSSVLRKALGHVATTELPGERGNMAIAGHRDTFFGELGKARPGDRIVLVTPDARHEYVVNVTRIAEPTDLSALDDGERAMLTLITCYPFNWVGPAPKRFIVQASLQ